jgi:hypothetical protein
MSTTMPVNEQNQAVSSCAPQQSKPVVAPPADVFETESALTMLLSIPGATAESVQITLHRNKLTISADANFAIPQGMKLTYAEFAVYLRAVFHVIRRNRHRCHRSQRCQRHAEAGFAKICICAHSKNSRQERITQGGAEL